MYRVLVVGDQNSASYQRELKGLAEIQKYFEDQAEFRLVLDPKEARKHLFYEQPQILIARAQFLFQYGIETMLDQNPVLKIILSSDDSTLEHVVSFFNQGICYYIQKPGLAYDYINGIQKAINQLKKQGAEFELKQVKLAEFRNYLREKELNQLVCGSLSAEERTRVLTEHLNCYRLSGAFNVLVFELSENWRLSAEELENARQAVFYHLQQYVLQNGILFFNEEKQIVLLLAKESLFSSPDRATARTVTARRIQQLSLSYHCRIKAGAGSCVERVEQIKLSYQQAKEALHLASGFSKTVLIDYMQYGKNLSGLTVPPQLMTQLKSQIQNPFGWANTLDQLSAHLNSQPVLSSDHIQYVAFKILSSLDQDNDDLFKQAIGLRTADDLFVMLRELGQPPENSSNTDSLIKRVTAYLSQNYPDPSLSLNKAAQSVYVSPSYLSRIFKQKLNLSFTDYLIKLRMEEAKKLCKQKGLKTAQIAAKVGYRDASYFTLCFKKYVGITPGGYRKTYAFQTIGMEENQAN